MSKRKEEVADENAVDQSFENRAKDVREDILDDIKVPEVVTNTELEAADHFVNTEKTTQAERGTGVYAMHRASHNRTLAGLPSDVHQALVTVSNQFRAHAAAREEVKAVLDKYEKDELPAEVRSLLADAEDGLEAPALVYEKARELLEKHV